MVGLDAAEDDAAFDLWGGGAYRVEHRNREREGGGKCPTYAASATNDGVAAKVAEIADSTDSLPGRVGEDGEVESGAF